ncbi:MAG: biopolymer transporter ExbD [Phycisphaerales bacterium]|nr:biopolymer transporter ExbD [Phycisphaerales bacterium]
MRQVRRVRRSSNDVHVELTPMIDVVFLLLTFFVFSIVLMVRADVLDVNLPQLTSGRSADRIVPITIAINDSGIIFINREEIEMNSVIDRLKELKTELGDSPLVLAVDTRSDAGIMITLADKLTGAGMGEFSIIGNESNEPNANAQEDIDPQTP